MQTSILEYVKKLPTTISKVDAISTIKNADAQYANEMIPLLEEVSKTIDGKNINVSRNYILSSIASETDLDRRDAVRFVKGLLKGITSIGGMSNDISRIVNDNFESVIAKDTLTYRQATVLRIVDYYTFIVLYAADLVDYIVTTDNVESVNPTSKSKIKDLKESAVDFGVIYGFMMTYQRNLKTEVDKLSNNIVLGKSDMQLRDNVKGIAGLANRFSGNPIYHFRMWLVDREIKKLKNLEDKKKLTILRITELKNQRENQASPALDKQIKFYEDKLATIEYQIQEIEEN